jgi:folate-dependent phosphoribosylglycinamide formyltransferase PurN
VEWRIMELEVHPALEPLAHGAYAHPQDLQQQAGMTTHHRCWRVTQQ